MKRIFFICLCLFLLPTGPPYLLAEELKTATIMENQEKSLDLEDLEGFIEEMEEELTLLFPEFSLRQIIDKFKNGDLDFAPQEILRKIFTYFGRELMLNLSLLGKLLVVALFGVLLQTLQSAFARGGIARLAYFVCLLALLTLTIGSFKIAIQTGLSTINQMAEFMKLLLPILLVLLTTLGGLTTTALLQPFLLVALSFMSTFTQKFIFPLILLTTVLCLTDNLAVHFKISQLVRFFKQITKVSIGLVLTVFVGIISVEGVLGVVVDGVTLRTAKYMTGAFIPVAGSMFADALDAVLGGSLLLKNALGLAGVLILGVIVLFPVLKVLALAVIYRVTAALLQPLDDSWLTQTLEEMAGCLFLTFAAVAAVALMFFMTIVVLVSSANFTVMLR